MVTRMKEDRFLVDSSVTPLTVSINDNAVTRIHFGRRTNRPPQTPLERQIATELTEYFAGTRRHFTFPLKPEGTAFEKRVWQALLRIPYGDTRTYGEIARSIGNPTAARAVGTANGRNPIPIVVPCHRVVAANGKLGGFGGGLPLKKKLLSLETANSPALT